MGTPSASGGVSLVIPCYQEAETVPAFEGILAALTADQVEEVLFVDDGSTDGTAEALRALASADPRVRVLVHPANRGVGAAMRTGFAGARGAVVAVYDADRPYPLADLAALVRAVAEGADVATASPFAAGGGAEGVPVLRRWLSQAAARAYALALGPWGGQVRTWTCAFRAYRRQALQGIRVRSDGFPAAAEILGALALGGARIAEVPSLLCVRTAGRSKMRVARALCGHLVVLTSLWRRRLRGGTTTARRGGGERTPRQAQGRGAEGGGAQGK